jgi:hypothetical protein
MAHQLNSFILFIWVFNQTFSSSKAGDRLICQQKILILNLITEGANKMVWYSSKRASFRSRVIQLNKS